MLTTRERFVIASGATLIPVATVLIHLEGALGWPTALLPLGLAAFTFVWSYLLTRWIRQGLALLAGLIVGVIGAYVMLWYPFLLRSYAIGHGPSGFDFALFAGLFTSALVGWYTMSTHLWQTLALVLGLLAWVLAVLALARSVRP